MEKYGISEDACGGIFDDFYGVCGGDGSSGVSSDRKTSIRTGEKAFIIEEQKGTNEKVQFKTEF